jgi:predicted DNA binding CopG/RHH family protein
MKTKIKLDDEELEILEALNNNKLVSSETSSEDITNAKIAALNTINSFEEVRIEIPVRDLQILKKKALQSGITYQNLITALIHKYLDKLNVTILTD